MSEGRIVKEQTIYTTAGPRVFVTEERTFYGDRRETYAKARAEAEALGGVLARERMVGSVYSGPEGSGIVMRVSNIGWTDGATLTIWRPKETR